MNTISEILQVAGVIGFPFLIILIYFRAVKRKTQTILNSLPKSNITVFRDARIWFKGYDMMSRKKKFQIDPLKLLYSFNIADLYVQSDKLIVVGKTKMWGGLWGKEIMLQPFAICWIGREVQEAGVTMLTTQLGTKLNGNDIEIEFSDYEYSKNVTLVIKKIGKELYDLVEGAANKSFV
jgi:hypothetical protein